MRRLAYWTCCLLVLLPTLHQVANRAFDWHLAFAVEDFYSGLNVYNALLLHNGGLAPDYVQHATPGWLWRLVLAAGAILIVRRIVLAFAARSLQPPATFRGWSTIVAALALGVWCFHALASFGVPVIYHLYLVLTFRIGVRTDVVAAVLLWIWFWPTELGSIPWWERFSRVTAQRGR